MDTSIAAERQVLVGWARQILAALGKRADVAAIQEVTQAINGLLSDRFCLAVLGKAKRGKSTLLNAVLGRKDDTLAPVDKLPASSAISRFRWADTERATVGFRDGRQEQIGVERIREFVTEEFNKENAKGVNLVEIEGPFPRLDHDVELVDTPGAGSIHEHHDALLHAFIPQADAVIFLVTARMPLDQDELDLLQQVKAADIRKVFFAVNKVDESSEQDIADQCQGRLQRRPDRQRRGGADGRDFKLSGHQQRPSPGGALCVAGLQRCGAVFTSPGSRGGK